jgi:Tol biopolymer transport system component
MVTWASYNGPLGFTILLRSEAISHELWELDANTGETRRLTNPDVTPFKIANGDWAVSPDGQHVAFGEPRSQHLAADADGLVHVGGSVQPVRARAS